MQISITVVHPKLTIGRIADLAAVSANAVRYYERAGLMPVPAKSSNGYRLYGVDAVEQLRFIKQAQRSGFTLAEILELLRLRTEVAACCGDVRGKVIEKKLSLESRIRELREMSKALDQLLDQCSDAMAPVQDCTILNSLTNVSKRSR